MITDPTLRRLAALLRLASGWDGRELTYSGNCLVPERK